MSVSFNRAAPIGIAVGVALVASALLAMLHRAPAVPVDELPGHLSDRFQMQVTTAQVAPGGNAPWGPGEPVQIWGVAADDAGSHLFHVSGRRRGEQISVSGRWQQISHDVPVAKLLAVQPHRALVALTDPTGFRTIEMHDRVGEAGRLQLTQHTAKASTSWTTHGFSLETDSGLITVERGRVTPSEAGVWLPNRRTQAPRMVDLAAPASVIDTLVDGAGWSQMALPGGAVHVSPPRLTLRFQPALTDPIRPLEEPVLRWIAAPMADGAAVDGVALQPLQRGGAAVWIDPQGRAAIGPFAGEPDVPQVGVLRQAGTPLIVDGRAVQIEADTAAARAGLGIRADGRLVVAQSTQILRRALGQAMARHGAVQAVEIRASGLLAAGTTPDARLDWFAVVAPRGLSGMRWQADGWRGIADGRMAVQRRGAVDLVLIDPQAVRMQLAPGLAEIGGSHPVPPEGHWLIGGVRSARAAYGLKLGPDNRRSPRDGKLALVINAKGQPSMRVIRGEGQPGDTVIQGPLLLRAGQAAIELPSPPGETIAAIGRRHDGRFVFAHTQAGTDALVEALETVAVQDAMRMGNRSTADAGQVLDLTDGTPRPHLPASVIPSPWAGTALVIESAPRRPQLQPAQAIRVR